MGKLSPFPHRLQGANPRIQLWVWWLRRNIVRPQNATQRLLQTHLHLLRAIWRTSLSAKSDSAVRPWAQSVEGNDQENSPTCSPSASSMTQDITRPQWLHARILVNRSAQDVWVECIYSLILELTSANLKVVSCFVATAGKYLNMMHMMIETQESQKIISWLQKIFNFCQRCWMLTKLKIFMIYKSKEADLNEWEDRKIT